MLASAWSGLRLREPSGSTGTSLDGRRLVSRSNERLHPLLPIPHWAAAAVAFQHCTLRSTCSTVAAHAVMTAAADVITTVKCSYLRCHHL